MCSKASLPTLKSLRESINSLEMKSANAKALGSRDYFKDDARQVSSPAWNGYHKDADSGRRWYHTVNTRGCEIA